MGRKIVFSLVVIASIALIVFYLYDQTTDEVVIHDELSSPIPRDAVSILEISDVVNSYQDLKNGNMLYEEFLQAGMISDFDVTWHAIDSIVFTDEQWRKYFQHITVTYSLHPVGQRYNYMVSFPISNDSVVQALQKQMMVVIGDSTSWSNKQHAGAQIMIASIGESKLFSSFYKGQFLWSPSSIIIEKAIRTLDSGNSIQQVEDFVKVKNTASTGKKMHLYMDYRSIPTISEIYLQSSTNQIMSNTFGGWAEMDMTIKPNSLLLSGFLLCPDTLNYYLHCFDDQESDDIEVVEVMPTNIAWFMHANISDPLAFYKNNVAYWSELGMSKKIKKRREIFIQKTGWDLIEFQKLIHEELALAVIESNEESVDESYSLFMKIEDVEKAESVLNDLRKAYQQNTDNTTKQSSYRSYKYWSIGSSDLIELSFGPIFSPMNKPVFTLIDNYLIVSNSLRSNKNLINHYLSDQTLAKDLHYNNFMANTSNDANLTIYTNIARAPNYYKKLLNDKVDEFIDNKLDVFRQFQAVSIQFEKSKKGKYYQTIYCKYNPVYKNETTSLWELALDTSFTQKTFDVVNHNTQQKELFLQDDRLDVYLVSNTGKVLWKKKLDEPIIGEPLQVDRYRNKKLQMLFLTKNYIHLLDRNGKTVEGFPIRLPAETTSHLAVMDYDNNRRYRLLVGCKDGNIYNFDITGKSVEGWSYSSTESPVVGKIKHFKISDNDYVICQSEDGHIQVINRKGEVRYDVSSKVNISGDFIVVKRKDIAKTTLIHSDKDGKIISTQLDGTHNILVDDEHLDVIIFENKDQRGMLVNNGDELILYDVKGEVISKIDTENDLRKLQVHFSQESAKIHISGVSSDNIVYLYDTKGNLENGFPLTGSSLRTITNLGNNEQRYMIVGDLEGMLYVYLIGKM